jgi:ABC-type multidrug transport system fused ATPase/permease subunit
LTTFKKLLAVLDPAQRRAAWVLLFFMLIGMFCETLGVGLIIPALALMTEADLAGRYPQIAPVLEALGHPDRATLIIGGMLALVGVYVVKAMILVFLSWKQARFVFGLQESLSQRLFTGYLRRPYTFHLQRNSAQLIRNITGEVGNFTSVAQTSLLLLTESLVMFGVAVLLFFIEPIGSFLIIITLGFSSFLFNRFTRLRLTTWGLARQHHEGMRIQHLQQGLGGAKDVKLLGREDDFLNQYAVHNQGSARVGCLQSVVQSLPRLWLELLGIMGLATLVLVMLAQNKPFEALVPTVGLFAAAAFRLIPSVNRALNSIQNLRYMLPVINVIHAEITMLAEDAVSAKKKTPLPLGKNLQLCDLAYTYPNAPVEAVSSVTLTIPCGASVGFVGGSGAGKSTLVDVVLGLLTPTKGQVLVDGVDIQSNLRGWQDQIGYVPQSIYLTDDTLRRNVAFGLAEDKINDQAVKTAVHAAQLDDFVAELPKGLETEVGERGIRLSGGQRQRIGIARALYHDPAVLVLDEATSALDTETERGVMQSVTALKGQKTVIIVAHRTTTVQHCDKLYRLEQGRIIAEGTPNEILAAKNW